MPAISYILISGILHLKIASEIGFPLEDIQAEQIFWHDRDYSNGRSYSTLMISARGPMGCPGSAQESLISATERFLVVDLESK